jgi:hypothetical protein
MANRLRLTESRRLGPLGRPRRVAFTPTSFGCPEGARRLHESVDELWDEMTILRLSVRGRSGRAMPDWILGSLYVAGPGAVAAALALAFATNGRRIAALLGLGALLGLTFVLLAYYSAPTLASESNCSDCGYYGGRYWEAQLVIARVVWNLAAWSAAVLVGAAARRWFLKRHASRHREPAWR